MKKLLGTIIETGNGDLTNKALQRYIKDHIKEIKANIMGYAPRFKLGTQEDIANALNVSRVFFNEVINGKKPFPVDMLLRLSKLLNCSIDYLIGLDDEETAEKKKKRGQKRADYLNAYLLSFGLNVDKKGRYILQDRNGSYKANYVISSEDFEKLKSQIDDITETMIYNAFIRHGGILIKQRERKSQND